HHSPPRTGGPSMPVYTSTYFTTHFFAGSKLPEGFLFLLTAMPAGESLFFVYSATPGPLKPPGTKTPVSKKLYLGPDRGLWHFTPTKPLSVWGFQGGAIPKFVPG